VFVPPDGLQHFIDYRSYILDSIISPDKVLTKIIYTYDFCMLRISPCGVLVGFRWREISANSGMFPSPFRVLMKHSKLMLRPEAYAHLAHE